MTKWLVLMVGILVMTAVARAGNEPSKQNSVCEAALLAKPYTTPMIAGQICERFPQSTVGCAMDMVDMGMESDIYEAIEYCATPIVRR